MPASPAHFEEFYLRTDDPVAQSGFGGGRERWIAERSPLVEAIVSDGTFLDVGCAVGLLAGDVVEWAAEKGVLIEPFGVDFGPRLIELARLRHRRLESNFAVADAWAWEPDRQWTYVYSLLDLALPSRVSDWLDRLASWVEPGGRLIIGSYGSRSRGVAPDDVGYVMERGGLTVEGESQGGDPVVTRFAWADPATREAPSV